MNEMKKNEMYFTVERVSPHITRIRGVIGENMYLVEGAEKVLLIDTGCGIGDIAGFVRTLTDKPFSVVLTHNHYDHCGGMYRFPEVYLNQKEREPNTVSYTEEKGREMLKQIGSTDESVLPTMREMHFLDLEPGMVFELGEARVETLICPGHTAATTCFLILPERMLLSGDACHQITYLQFPEALPLREFAENLAELRKREDEWDSLLLSHFPNAAPKTLVEKMQMMCGELLKLSEEELQKMAETKESGHPLIKAEYHEGSRDIFYIALKDGSAEMLLRKGSLQESIANPHVDF